MCKCQERDFGQVDVRRLAMDAETRARLSRYGSVSVKRTATGVEVEADGVTVTAPDGPTAVRYLASALAEIS